MQGERFYELLQESPIIAAVKDEEGLARCLLSECRVVFVLYGDLLHIGQTAAKIKAAGKIAMVHADLIDGLSARDVAIDFLAGSTEADGIISTKGNLIKRAKACDLLTVHRFFLLDSLALTNIRKQLLQDAADAVEILPGVMPKVIGRLTGFITRPVIAGGLISDKEDVLGALSAGAAAVSSTNPAVWFL